MRRPYACSLSMATYLVTGGGGFIGGAIVRELIARGQQVRVLDDFSTGKRENLADLQGKVQVTEGSVAELDVVRRAMEGAEFVIHQAALPSVARSVEAPLESNRANALGTLCVLEAARQVGVSRVVYAASSSAYGETEKLPKDESIPPAPQSPYAASKLAGEHYAAVYSHCYGLATVSLRYFNIFGPRQDPQSQYAAVIPRFITSYMRRQPPTIYGDGRQTRDFCYVDNAVAANLLACTAPDVAGQMFNISCGDEIDLLGVLDLLADMFGYRVEPIFEPARAGDIRRSRASIERAEKYLGYQPAVRFPEGLRRTTEWFQKQKA